MDLTKIRERAMREGMKLMQEPLVLRLLRDPRAQRLIVDAVQLPGRIEGVIAAQGKALARRFRLATRDVVEQLKSVIRDLERNLRELQPRK